MATDTDRSLLRCYIQQATCSQAFWLTFINENFVVNDKTVNHNLVQYVGCNTQFTKSNLIEGQHVYIKSYIFEQISK